MSPRPHHHRPRAAAAIVLTSALTCSGLLLAVPAQAAELIPVPKDTYKVLSVDSEAGAWPAPPAKDGTGAGAFDDDYNTQWASNYGAKVPFPHWVALDLQRSVSVKQLTYAMRPSQGQLAVKGARVYVTNDPDIAALKPTADNLDAWGAPAATITLPAPTAADQEIPIDLATAVTGRYVMIVALSNHSGGTTQVGAGIGELRVLADKALPPVGTDPDPEPGTGASVQISGGGLTASVAKGFPQVRSYAVNGSTFGGQGGDASLWNVNGVNRKSATTSTVTGSSVTYVSKLEGVDVTITSVLKIVDGNLVFEVTDVAGSTVVNNLGLPNNSFVSIDSTTPGATLDRTTISPDSTKNNDEHVAITADAATSASGANIAFLGNGTTQASVISNATVQDSSGNASWNNRITTKVSGTAKRTAELGSGTWLIHPIGATDARVTTYELPKVTVLFAGDRNADGASNWQDGAIRFREVDAVRLGADRVAERVVNRIPFNFASSATNYFDLTLDNTKRIANNTDGLGQWVLNKGYGSEGHDSANTDYGGNYNERAGDLAALNNLVDEGKALNADMTVHVNAFEIYPQSNSFDPAILTGTAPYNQGWSWLDTSYGINQQKDLGGGTVLNRFQQLRDEVPNLSGVYIDVYYANGWAAEGLANQLRGMDLEIATEWGDKFVDNSVWGHWPNDLSYGGKDNKGINSTMVRFIQNGQADIWNDDVLLGQQRLIDFEGWSGNSNWNGFVDNVWQQSLPTKFLQHFDLLTYKQGEKATFTDGVEARIEGGKRIITLGGKTVLSGDSYLLPWQTVASNDDTGTPVSADKMYFYSATGGAKTFDLTAAFAGNTAFDVYKLGDTGRTKVTTVTASGGKLTITGDAKVAYVVEPQGGAQRAAVAYADAGLNDPGFNAGNLTAWNPTGDAKVAVTASGNTKADPTGDNIAQFGAAASSLSQKVTGLTPGQKYSFSAQVQIAPSALRDVTVSVDAAGSVSKNTWKISPTYNYQRADSKSGLYYQRGAASFVAPASGEVTVKIAAAAGSATVSIDNARIMTDTTAATKAGAYYSEDFEGNQAGWGPFVKGDANGIDDPRTSISKRHDPYTSAAWRNTASPYATTTNLAGRAVDTTLTGEHSLVAHGENVGGTYRSDPTVLKFEAGHKYRVAFNYQLGASGSYVWQQGTDAIVNGKIVSSVSTSSPLGEAHATTAYTQEFTAGCGANTWVGLSRTGGLDVDFVLDDLVVTDLGTAPGGVACGAVAGGVPSLSPGAQALVTTTFTNAESTVANNVAQTLKAPAGYDVKVADSSSNLFPSVAVGATVSTVWVVTAPAADAGKPVSLEAGATYAGTDCIAKSVSVKLDGSVAAHTRISNAGISVSANSQETQAAGEGPAALVLDGNANTIWHSQYVGGSGSYPYTLTFDLGRSQKIEGLSYLPRPSGENGKLKDYTVSVSTDGTAYTQAAAGSFTSAVTWQDVTFAATTVRYVKLTATNSINGAEFGSAAEIAFFGTPTAIAAHAPKERPADTGCAAPKVALGSSSVSAGSSLRVDVSGVTGAEPVDVYIDGVAAKLGTITPAGGAGGVSVTIPANTTAGEHTITVRRGATDIASAKVTVVAAAPVATLKPITRCVAGKVVLAVTVEVGGKNASAIKVTTAFGDKTIGAVAAGKVSSVVYTTGKASLTDGTVTAVVTVDGVAHDLSATYTAATCG